MQHDETHTIKVKKFILVIMCGLPMLVTGCAKNHSEKPIPGLIQEEDIVISSSVAVSESESLESVHENAAITSSTKQSEEMDTTTSPAIPKQQVTKSSEAVMESSQAMQPSEQQASSTASESSSESSSSARKESASESKETDNALIEVPNDIPQESPIEVPREASPEEASDDRAIRLPMAP